MEKLNRLESKDGVELTEIVYPLEIKDFKDFIEYFRADALALDFNTFYWKTIKCYQTLVNKIELTETIDELTELESQIIVVKKELVHNINNDYSRIFPTALTAYKGWIDERIKHIKEQDSLYNYAFYFKLNDLLADVRNRIELLKAGEDVKSNKSSLPLFEFENKFDHVPPKRVYDYFKKELVDTSYLSLEDLQKYLIMAFQDETFPTEKFEIKGKHTTSIIRTIFVKYYNEIAQDKHGLKLRYCKLLGEFFLGFDTIKLQNNFR
jgi:hypothetical protein